MTIIADQNARRRLIQRAEGTIQLLLDCSHDIDRAMIDPAITHHQQTLLAEADQAFERGRKAIRWAIGYLTKVQP